MSVYIYRLSEDYRYQSSIKGREFENEWCALSQDGMILVKGTHYKGYAWDGCSPKIKIKDIYIGTPEAVLNFNTGQSKTYWASLIHDVFYQFSKEMGQLVARSEVDREFYHILKRDQFAFAGIYYQAVRMLGWLFWNR